MGPSNSHFSTACHDPWSMAGPNVQTGFPQSLPAHFFRSVFRTYLVGCWTNPFEKYARQIGSFAQKIGMSINKYLKTPPPSIWFHFPLPTMDGRIVPGSVKFSVPTSPLPNRQSSLPFSAASTTVSAGISSNTSGFFTSFSLEKGWENGVHPGGVLLEWWNFANDEIVSITYYYCWGRKYPKHPTNHRLEGHKTM